MKKSQLRRGEILEMLENLPVEKVKQKFLLQLRKKGHICATQLLYDMEYRGIGFLKQEIEIAHIQKNNSLVKTLSAHIISHYHTEELYRHLLTVVEKMDIPTLTKTLVHSVPFTKDGPGYTFALDVLDTFQETGSRLYVKCKKETRKYTLANTKQPHVGAEYLLALKEYKTAINHLIKHGSEMGYAMSMAWEIACEHVPRKKKEIAKIFLNRPEEFTRGRLVTLLECGRELKKEEEVVSTINRYLPELEKQGLPPRFYGSHLSVSEILGDKEMMQEVFDKLIPYFESRYATIDSRTEMAMLYFNTGNVDVAKEWMIKQINIYLEFSPPRPANIEFTAKKWLELTGDNSLYKYLLPVYEGKQKYKKASQVAKKIGDTKKAKLYKKMSSVIKN